MLFLNEKLKIKIRKILLYQLLTNKNKLLNNQEIKSHMLLKLLKVHFFTSASINHHFCHISIFFQCHSQRKVAEKPSENKTFTSILSAKGLRLLLLVANNQTARTKCGAFRPDKTPSRWYNCWDKVKSGLCLATNVYVPGFESWIELRNSGTIKVWHLR